ncbi:MAG TPA: ABC transporter permease [Xanthobacteraceae bacterium]|jgi:ribose transport system permease protein
MSASNPADVRRPLVGRYIASLRWRWLEDSGLVFVFIAMLLAIGIPYPEFFSFGSVKTILRQSALVGIIAFGMVYLVAMIEIDLSVGGIFAVAGSLSALLIKFHHVDPWIAVAIALLAGTGLGALNGILTSLLRVPLIIVSLGTLSGYFGLHLILSDGKAIYGLPKNHPFFRLLGSDLFELPASVWTALVCAIVLYFVFARTRFGATVRAIGSNPAAAEFIGVRTGLIRIYATALVGFLAAVSGVMTLAYFKAVDTSSGRNLGLQVIAGVVIGGTSLAGGSGTILGAALGVLIITTIDSGLVFYGVNLNYSEFVTGCVIIGAIALDRVVKRRRTQ